MLTLPDCRRWLKQGINSIPAQTLCQVTSLFFRLIRRVDFVTIGTLGSPSRFPSDRQLARCGPIFPLYSRRHDPQRLGESVTSK